MKVYLSGQMTGLVGNGNQLFNQWEETLIKHDVKVVNPARLYNDAADLPYAEYMRRDLQALLDPTITGIALLPNWIHSPGAKIELRVAQTLNLKIYAVDGLRVLEEKEIQDGLTHPSYGVKPNATPVLEPDVCTEANKLINGDRQDSYEHPRNNFKRIADMLTGAGFRLDNKELNASNVAHIMILLKVARDIFKPKRDNWVDICGYGGCLEKIKTGR